MANPIENKQLADALNEINKLGKSIEQTFKGISDQAKKVGESSEDLAKNLDFSKSKDIKVIDDLLKDLTKRVDDLTEALKGRDEATQKLTKQEKLLLKLQKEQAESTDDLAVAIQEVKLERQQSTKAAKEQAKENKGLTNTLDKQRKKLNELQRELTNAALEGRLNEESVKAQKEEFERLFKAITEAEQQFGNFRRQVGNYAIASEEAIKQTEKLEKAIAKVKGASIAFGAAIGAGGLVGKALKSNDETLDDLTAATAALDAVFADVAGSAAGGFAKGVDIAEKNAKRAGRSANFAEKAIIGLGGAIDEALGSVKTIDQTFKLQQNLTAEIIKFERALQDGADGTDGYLTQLAKLTNEYEELTTQADFNTISLEERNELIEKAIKASEEAFIAERGIAQQRVDLFETQLEIAKGNELATKAILKELTEARLALLDVESREIQQLLVNTETRRQILQDQAELELDILIDAFDNQKTINERTIANIELNLKDRQKLFKETEDLANESYEKQQKAVLDLYAEERSARQGFINQAIKDQQFGLKQLEGLTLGIAPKVTNARAFLLFTRTVDELEKNSIINAEERKKLDEATVKIRQGFPIQAEEQLFLENLQVRAREGFIKVNEKAQKQLDQNILTQEKLTKFLEASPIEQAKLREELGVSEIISTRLLEISRERRTVQQDLLELAEDLNDEQFDQLKLISDIALQEEALAKFKETTREQERQAEKEFEALEEKRFNDRKRFLEKELKDAEDGSTEKLRLEKELNDLLLEEEKKFRKKVQEEREKAETIRDVGFDIEDQQKALEELGKLRFGQSLKANEVLQNLSKDRLENEKQILELQLENVEEGSVEEIRLKKELNDVLLQLEQDRIDEEKELRDEALQAVANGAEFIGDQLIRLSEARVENIENEIDALSRTEDRLREDIANGAELAGESLTGIQEQRDALALEREQELKKQARLELLVAGSQLLAQSGSFEEAASDIVKLQTLISTILRGPGLHDGGYTGDGGEWEFANYVHKGEFVNTAKQVSNYGMRGWSASDFDKAVQSGYFNQFSENLSSDYLNQPIQFSRPASTDSPRLISAVEQVKQAVLKSIDDKPRHDKRWIEEAKEMEYKISTKTRVEKERIKSFRY